MSLTQIDWAGWSQLVVYRNPLGAWLGALALMLMVAAVLPFAQRRIGRRLHAMASHDGARISPYVDRLVAGTRRSVLWLVAVFVGARALELPPKIDATLGGVVAVAMVLQAALWAQCALDVWLQRRLDQARLTDLAAATTVSMIGFFCRVALWTLALLMILDNLGFNVTTLVASLGIGGVAVALAVQNILGDLFASLSIALDKPFVVGDFIVVDAIAGTVEYIGLKTTRLRSLDGEQVVFANADLLKSRIHNYKRLYERRVLFGFGVDYQASPEQLSAIPAMVHEAISAQPATRFDRAHFKGFSESSLDFEVVYIVLDPDFNKYMDIQQAINLELLRRFREVGIRFAAPTQRVQIERPAAAPATRPAVAGA